MTVAKELQEKANVTPAEGESEEKFANRLARAVHNISDDAWEELTQEAQEWTNNALEAIEKHSELPALPGFEAVAAAEGEAPVPKKKAAAKKDAAKKPAKKAPAAKKAAKAESAGRRGPRGSFADTDKIKLLVKGNPYRESSQSHGVFAKYKNNMTVKAALEAGITKAYLRWDLKKEHISIG